MEYHKLNRPASKQKRAMAMRFFAKQRSKRDGQQEHSSTGEVETRTDVMRVRTEARDLGSRDHYSGHYPQTQQLSSPGRKGKQSLLRSPRSREEKYATNTSFSPSAQQRGPSPRSRGRTSWTSEAPEKQVTYHGTSSQPMNNRAPTPRQSPRQAEKRPVSLTPTRTSVGPNGAKSPSSILHKNSNFSTTPSPSPTFNMSPQAGPTFNMSPQAAYAHNSRRVQFMSSGSSVASQSTASGVHLMAGTNSIASSSAMSSSDKGENVFDRVLHMVMAEENERLNAMGMDQADPKSDYAARAQRQQQRARREATNWSSRADDAPRRVAAPAGGFAIGDDDDLGLIPPRRGDLAPIDIDTGLEIDGSHEVPLGPIDMDTGMEVGARQHFGSFHHKTPIDIDSGLEIKYSGEGVGVDCDYHDLNDDDIDEQQWQELNDAAMMVDVNEGMNELKLDNSRRVRSSPSSSSSSRQQPRRDGHRIHNSFDSDPSRYRRSGSDSRKSPSRKGRSSKGKKTSKQFCGDDVGFDSDKWVAFDNQRPPNSGKTTPGPVSDLAAF